MQATMFDGISRDLGQSATRRSVFRLLGGAAAMSTGLVLVAQDETQAKNRGKHHGQGREQVSAQGKGKGKKVTICYQNQTRLVKKSKLGTYPGATRGACPDGSGSGSGGSGSGGTGSTGVVRADAACPGPGGITLGTAFANARFAQTFTARASGQLVSAQVSITKVANTSGDYVATINTVDANGVPTNTVLATASIPNSEMPAGELQASFAFPTPAAVVAGTQYALVVSRTGPEKLTLRGDGGNRCIGGAFDSPNQTDPLRSSGAAIDFDFTTFVRS
jgi:hypothetical protein